MERVGSDPPAVLVVGGAVAGLAAAERFSEFANVTLYERQSYDAKRVNCGEAINDASLVPLAPTPENGFLNDVDGYEIRVYRDAAGVANRYQGEGICQAIRSSYLLADLVEADEAATYPDRLYRSMRAEYRLASLMRGAWEEHEDPDLLAALVGALDGLTVDQVTREPRAVLRRLLARPDVVARLVADRGMLRRVVDAYTDTWEYDRPRPA